MTQFVFANNVNTTLASSISSSATTLTLASSANLPSSIPAGEYFVLTLNDAATRLNYEIVYATAVSGATLTVVRGQEGTSAQAWLLGDFIYSGPTAGQMESFGAGGVTSFNTRTGAVTLTGSDVNTALGYTAANDANVVHKTGNESVGGTKTFTSGPVITGSSFATASVSFLNSGNGNVQAIWLGQRNLSPSNIQAVITTDPSNSAADFFTVNIANGNTTVAGSLTYTTSNATGSDRRLKRDIKRLDARPLHRKIAYVEFTRIADDSYGRGAIAQAVKRHAPEYVTTFQFKGKSRYALDYQSMAYEQAMWAGAEIDRMAARLAKLERDLARAKIKPRERGLVRRLLERVW